MPMAKNIEYIIFYLRAWKIHALFYLTHSVIMLYLDRQTDESKKQEHDYIHGFTKVSWADRFTASLWDTLIFWGVYIISAIPLSLLSLFRVNSQLGILLCYSVSVTWWSLRDGNKKGAGYGKNKDGFMVINTKTKTKCSLLKSFLRNNLSTISALICIVQNKIPLGYATLIFGIIYTIDVLYVFSETGQRVGDRIAHTLTVYQEEFYHPELAETNEESIKN
jgi:hypothetical protein